MSRKSSTVMELGKLIMVLAVAAGILWMATQGVWDEWVLR